MRAGFVSEFLGSSVEDDFVLLPGWISIFPMIFPMVSHTRHSSQLSIIQNNTVISLVMREQKWPERSRCTERSDNKANFRTRSNKKKTARKPQS
eukprot:COSAG02_NODE_723_length_18041_cov_7.464720_19_plen_94_part_00